MMKHLLEKGSSLKFFLADFWLIFLVLSGLFTFCLGLRPLGLPDEGRYVEIPREMVVTGDWITPHLNGLPYFEKPPLVYWIEAVTIKIAGLESVFWLRFPIACFALLGCLLLYGFCRYLGKNRMAFWAPFVLGTSVLYALCARIIILDLIFTVFMTAGLLSFFLASRNQQRLLWIASYGINLALATLSKGLIGILLPGVIIILWIMITRQWRYLREAFHPLALGLFLLISVPWHVAISLENPIFFSFYFIHEHFIRYLTTVHGRYAPPWFFIPVGIVGLFPWVVFLPEVIRVARERRLPLPEGLASFLWIWAGFIFVFFSFSSSKLIPYILPLFPPLALLIAAFLTQNLFPPYLFKIYAALTGLFGLSVLLYAPLDHVFLETPYDFRALTPLLISSMLFLGGGLWGVATFYKNNPQKAHFSILISFIGFLPMFFLIDPHVQRFPSIRPLMRSLKPFLCSETPVVLWGDYIQDVPVYLDRVVQVVHYQGELNSGGGITPDQDRLLTFEAFQKLWETPTRVFLIAWARNPQDIPTLSAAIPHLTMIQHQFPYVVCTNLPLTPELVDLVRESSSPFLSVVD